MPVSECCCGCSLRSGTIAIGYFYSVTGVILSIACLYWLILSSNVGSELLLEVTRIHVVATFTLGLVLALIQAAVSVSLAYGAYQERPGYLVPWMVFATIGCVLSTIFVIINCILNFTPGDTLLFIPLIGLTVKVALVSYFLIVVGSYRKSLQETQHREKLVGPKCFEAQEQPAVFITINQK